MKQSYLLFSWFHYLTTPRKSQNNKLALSIAYLPNKKKNFTATKAPMAHKTNSKEQFSYAYHKFSVSFKIHALNNRVPSSLNAGLGFALIIKKYFKFFETNLFLAKSVRFFFQINCVEWLNYYSKLNKLTNS